MTDNAGEVETGKFATLSSRVRIPKHLPQIVGITKDCRLDAFAVPDQLGLIVGVDV